VREYAFELALCRQLEAERDGVVSRQLSTGVHGRRVMDVVCVSPGPEFDERRAITPETIPPAAIESEVGAGVATYWKEAFDCHPERGASAVERAVECGFFERERRNGRTYVRQTARYPDWYGRLLGIENKPDLGRPGALETQLLTDVELGLLDGVVLATASHVTGAHLNRIPGAVGVWRFDPDTGEREVLREPAQLPAGEHGIEILDRSSARAEIRVVTPDDLRRARLRVAERAYGKGWRTYDLPDCERVEPDDAGVPFCPWKGRIVRPAVDCGPACEGYEHDEQPAVDLRRLRAERSSWDPAPDGRQREQSGLDQFTDS
jgi:hypothetical protein